MNSRMIRLRRWIALFLGAAFSLLAVFSYGYTAQRVITQPELVLPDDVFWTAPQLEDALDGLGLPPDFYAVFTLTITLLFGLSFLVCGWLILLRRSQDWFGIYLALLLLSWANGVGVFSSMPNAPWIDGSHLGWFMWPGLFLLLYYFPSGHIVPRWTRWLAWSWILFSASMFVMDVLGALPENFLLFLPLIIAVLLVGGYAQIYRYRRAGGLERQQIKLVVFSLVLFAVFFVFFALTVNYTGLGVPGERSISSSLVYNISFTIGAHLVFMTVPISIAVAVLRYRLWDIDVVIRRTLVYAALTATLALVFFGAVTLLQSLFVAISGQKSAASVVISTLLIAALIAPLRLRIQNGIDRRFYRKKYDAEKTLERFAASLRDEVNLEDLQNQLVIVVQETLQPASLQLWLKQTKRLDAAVNRSGEQQMKNALR